MPARVCGRLERLSSVFAVFLGNVRARGPVKARPDERMRLWMVNRPAGQLNDLVPTRRTRGGRGGQISTTRQTQTATWPNFWARGFWGWGGIEGGHHHDVQAGALVGAPERVPSFECAGTGAQA